MSGAGLSRLLLFLLLVGCANSQPALRSASPDPMDRESLSVAVTPNAEKQLHGLRRQIDDVDADLVRLIAKRLALAQAVGKVKQTLGRPIVDLNREERVVHRFVERANAEGVDAALAEDVIRRLIAGAKERQREQIQVK